MSQEEKKESEGKAGVSDRPTMISKEEFKAQMKREHGLSDLGSAEISPDVPGEAKAAPAEVVPVPESAAVKDLSSKQISDFIVRRRHRLFDRSKKLGEYTVEELEILQEQKLREEKLQREREVDEVTLASMRADKKGYYESWRKQFLMRQPYEARLKAFFVYYTDRIRTSNSLENKTAMKQIQSWMELFGVNLVDKKHVFTDAEFEAFAERCKTEGLTCTFDVFAIHVRGMIREASPEGKHRLELYEKA